MTSPPVVPDEATLPPGPPPLALAVAHDLVTRYRLRLTDQRDGRLGPLGGDAYLLGAASWTGRRAAFVGFYQPPGDAETAARDLEQRVRAAESWANERLGTQGAERCDVLIVALGPVPKLAMQGSISGRVQVGAIAVDPSTAETQVVLQPVPPNVPSAGEIRAHARNVLQGKPVPTLAAVDLAERQMVAGGYAQPTRRAMTGSPLVTYGLIGLFVAVWLAEQSVTRIPNGSLRLFAFGAIANSGPATHDWWRYLSSGFLHDPTQPLHVLYNGIAMLYIGRLVEQLYGRLMLVGVFLLTVAAGNALWVLCGELGIAGISVSDGASGGIMGLIGLLAVLGRVQGRDVPVGVVSSLRQYALTFVVLTILVGFFVPNVNNFAHAGGFVAGALLGLVLPPRAAVGGRDLRLWETALLVAAMVAAAVALGLAAHFLADVLSQLQPGPARPIF